MEPLSESVSRSGGRTEKTAPTAVLVVEDDPSSLENLVAGLRESGHEVYAASSGLEAIEKMNRHSIDVVVSDVQMEGMNGLKLLEHVSEQTPQTAVIMITGYGTIESAVVAMRAGAYDYLSKPVDINKLELLIEKARQNRMLVRENIRLQSELRERYSFGKIVGRSEPMRRIFDDIEQVAETNATVLIIGESGTGKELIASAIHHNSSRADKALIKVNCAAFVESLIESELFGHEKGAFTGAIRTRKGRIELAEGGTLFLDEIGDLSLATQLKLLRVLQEREFERVGGSTTIPVDIRLIAATNKNLEQQVAKGRFREELYYRIKVVTLTVPPLRERTDDIPLLVNHFIQSFNKEHNKSVEGLSPQAMRLAIRYSWPGNVRELRNIAESLVVMAKSTLINERELPNDLRDLQGAVSDIAMPLGIALAEAERRIILGTLAWHGGNKARTARTLGIGKKTLYRKLQDYNESEGRDPE